MVKYKAEIAVTNRITLCKRKIVKEFYEKHLAEQFRIKITKGINGIEQAHW